MFLCAKLHKIFWNLLHFEEFFTNFAALKIYNE